MLHKSTMPTGEYILPPLSEFTVTETTPRSHLKKVDLFKWMSRHDIHYDVNYDKQLIRIESKLPDDIDPVLDEDTVNRGWKVEWNWKP